MSIQFSDLAETCRIFPSANTIYSNSFTYKGFFKTTSSGTKQVLCSLYSTSYSNNLSVQLSASLALQVYADYEGVGPSTSLGTLSTNTWYAFAIKGYMNSGTPTLKLYCKPVGGSELTPQTLAITTWDIGQIIVGNDFYSFLSGRESSVSLWNTPLADGDISTEFLYKAPQITSGLISYTPFEGADLAAALVPTISNYTWANPWLCTANQPTVNGDNPTFGITMTLNDTLPSDSTIVLTSNGGAAVWNLNMAENQTSTGATVQATGSGAITYSKNGGVDASKFNVNSSTGVVTFATAPNFEAPTSATGTNTYTVVIKATDTANNTINQTINVSVTNILETLTIVPTVTSIGNNGVFTVTVLDEGNRLMSALPVVWQGSPSGSVDGTTNASGIATLTAPSIPGNHTLSVTSGVISDTQDITVTAGNTAPTITSHNGASDVTIYLNNESTYVSTIIAEDPDPGQTLTYLINGGADSNKFTINSQTGVLSFKLPPNSQTPEDANGDNIYDVVVQVTDGIAIATQTFHVSVSLDTFVVRAYVHRKAKNTQGISGVVWTKESGKIVGEKLFEFEGLNFDADLVQNQAQLTIPIPQNIQTILYGVQFVRVYLTGGGFATPVFDAKPGIY